MYFLGVSYSNGYFQTWALNSRLRRIPAIGTWINSAVRWVCGKLTGHQPSKTEWGYGSGGTMDVWCRWCNQVGSVPLAEAEKRFEDARGLIWNMTGCDIRTQEWSGPSSAAAPSERKEKL